MIEVGNSVEIKGAVATTGAGTLTVSMKEIFLDGQWRQFGTPKSLNILTTDYTTSLTDQELELCKLLAINNKTNSSLTPDQQVIANSIIAKLTKV